MKSYKIRHIKEHLIIETDDGLWVLDTGAPSSFGSVDQLRIDDKTYEIAPEFMGFDNGDLSEAIGENIEGLVGVDILNNYDSYWDLSSDVITFSEEYMEKEGTTVPLDFVLGIPTLKVNLGGVSYNWFFDTGAVISYVTEPLKEWGSPVGKHDDFYPGYGNFSTDVYDGDIHLGMLNGPSSLRLKMSIKCGVLPFVLGMSLSIADCTGILGLSALNQQSFLYAPNRKQLILNV